MESMSTSALEVENEDVENTPDEVDELDTDSDDSEENDLEKVKEVLKKERELTRKAEARVRLLERDLRQSKTTKPEVDDDDISAKVDEKAAEVWKPIVVNSAARAAFAEAGATVTPRLLKMLDLSDLEVNPDGSVEGLDDQIADIKEDFPQLFVATDKKRRNIDSGPKGDKALPQKTASQKQAEAIFGR